MIRYPYGGMMTTEHVAEKLGTQLAKHRDAALQLPDREWDTVDHEGETNDAVREAVLDLYHDAAKALGLLDRESSASRQHYIETGAFLLHGEAITTPSPFEVVAEVVVEPEQLCEYFAMCDRPAEGIVKNPFVGDVPTCTRCAERMEQKLLPFPA